MSVIKDIFKGVKSDWRKIMLDEDSGAIKELKTILEELQEINQMDLTPNLKDIFTFAKFPLKDVRVVILGLDPYATRGDAHGLAFSTLATKCPASLRNIYKALINCELIDEAPKEHNLTHWAQQGILLLNTALTTLVSKSGEHIEMWSDYIDILIKQITEYHKNNKLIFCLWGKHTQSKSDLINNKKHLVLKYCHPVAYPPLDFTKCDHFTTISKNFKDIQWKFELVETIWSTDGSCIGNGSKNAKGSWGAYCHKAPSLTNLQGQMFGGKLKPIDIAYKGKMIKSKATNIRGEGLALINVMKLIKNHNMIGNHTIMSDSKFWIIDMLQSYIPKWIKNKSPWSDYANSDLTQEFWELCNEINTKYGSLEFIFVRAWHDYKLKDVTNELVDGRSKLAWQLNKLAEEAAKKHVN
jgi:uracil-DNA glycosylase